MLLYHGTDLSSAEKIDIAWEILPEKNKEAYRRVFSDRSFIESFYDREN